MVVNTCKSSLERQMGKRSQSTCACFYNLVWHGRVSWKDPSGHDFAQLTAKCLLFFLAKSLQATGPVINFHSDSLPNNWLKQRCQSLARRSFCACLSAFYCACLSVSLSGTYDANKVLAPAPNRSDFFGLFLSLLKPTYNYISYVSKGQRLNLKKKVFQTFQKFSNGNRDCF